MEEAPTDPGVAALNNPQALGAPLENVQKRPGSIEGLCPQCLSVSWFAELKTVLARIQDAPACTYAFLDAPLFLVYKVRLYFGKNSPIITLVCLRCTQTFEVNS